MRLRLPQLCSEHVADLLILHDARLVPIRKMQGYQQNLYSRKFREMVLGVNKFPFIKN